MPKRIRNCHKLQNMGSGAQIIARIRERGLLWASAHAVLYVWDKFFDFILYPLAIIKFGLIWGTAAMMAASLLICVVLLQLYDNLGSTRFRDLLGFESIKQAAGAVRQSRLGQLNALAKGTVGRLWGKVGLFLYLTLWFDPMTCTIFMRPAGQYRMTAGYWALFGLSVFIGNAVWGLLVYAGVETIGELLERFL